MPNVIRLGDPTSHGGKVIGNGTTTVKAGSVQLARVGDKVACPIKGHENCVITSGSARHRINGVQVAYDDSETTCGAKLISTRSTFSRK